MPDNDFDLIVVGGGAAGFFSAINAAEESGGRIRIIILEKTTKLLSKVKVSGGGRCNVTTGINSPSALVKNYPRGGKSLYKPFYLFGPKETGTWFEKRGVTLKTEADGRVFPISDDSSTIINCFLNEAKKLGIIIRTGTEVKKIKPAGDGFKVHLGNEEEISGKKLIITTGGGSKPQSYNWLVEHGISVAPPVPSLFTFNVPDSGMKELKGLSVPKGIVQIPGTKFREEGPILITHWGFSGPAVIRLSAWAAIDFQKLNYKFQILINWCGLNENITRDNILDFAKAHPKKLTAGTALFDIPTRLWKKLCGKAGILDEQRYLDLSKKQINKLIEFLIRDPYNVVGKTTFKEEFVTCGGVELTEIDLSTFESGTIPGLYFAGEVLNVDGITGGFNFQHAWTSGFLAGTSAARQILNEG